MFEYFAYPMKCNDCGEHFNSDDCNSRAEYVDDSNRPAYYVRICPFCGSDDIEEWEELEDECAGSL